MTMDAYILFSILAVLSFCTDRVDQEVLVGEADTLLQLGLVCPAKVGGFAYVQKHQTFNHVSGKVSTPPLVLCLAKMREIVFFINECNRKIPIIHNYLRKTFMII